MTTKVTITLDQHVGWDLEIRTKAKDLAEGESVKEAVLSKSGQTYETYVHDSKAIIVQEVARQPVEPPAPPPVASEQAGEDA